LRGVSGGGLPARIWRDFMREALGQHAAPKRRPDPAGPVEPLDLPDTGAIPLGQNSSLRIEDGGAVLNTQIGGAPVGVRIDGDTVRIEGGGGSVSVSPPRISPAAPAGEARQPPSAPAGGP